MFQKLLGKIARELNKRRIPYMVIGGQAVLLYGDPRMTRDIDVTLGVGPEALPLLSEALQSLGLRSLVEEVPAFVQRTMVLPAQDDESGIRFDFIFLPPLMNGEPSPGPWKSKLERPRSDLPPLRTS